MTIRPYLILLVSYTAGSTLTDDCPDAHAYDMEDIGWFHWKVLGVEGKNLTEQRERFVDVLLQGFDCERQIENMRCHGGSKVNVSCQQVRQRILANPKNSSTLVHNNRIAVRALIYGIDMQHVLCNTHKPPGLPPPNNERGCPPVDPSFLHYSGHWLFEYKLASKWKPKLMRHLVWRGCPENVAFVNRRQCYHLSSRTPLMSLICSSRIMGVISHLIQGNRIVSESHQSCDIKYAEDIFRTFGNARGPSNNWTMDKYGLSSILQNLSSPYPPLPVTNKTSHFPNYHQFNWGHVAPWENIPRPNNHIPGGHGGDETPPIPEYWIHNEPGPGEGTQSNTELNIIQTSHQKPWHGNRIPSPTDQNIKQESHTRPSNGVMTTSPTRVSSGQLLDSDRMNGSVKDISQIQGHTIEHGEGNKQHYLHTSEQSANGVSETRGKTGVKQLHMSVKQKSRRDVLNFPFPPDGLESNTRRFPRPSFNPTNTQASDLWNVSRLIDMMTGSPDDVFAIPEFYEMCPVLVHHLLFVLNLPVAHTPTPTNTSDTQPTNAKVYGFSSLAVFIITLCSLVGVIFVKIASGNTRQYVMASMLALAVGNLCGDAILHLVPEVIGDEGTDVDGDGHFTNEVMLLGDSDIQFSSVKMMLMLASIYVFFLLEMVTSIYHSHDHDIEMVSIPESQIPKKKTLTRVIGSTAHLVETTSNQSLSSMELAIPSADSISSLPSVPEEQEEPEPEVQVTVKKKKDETDLNAPMTLAWMVIVGDAIHNFADGLEIGATFSESLADGISTSLAVFCHELPHELGDFAVLISTGMSIKRALILNFVSGLTAFIGLYIGILTGQHDNVRTLIFAVGAGMFLYVALSNLVPELMKYFHRHRNWKMFFCQNIGLLAGYTVMVIIAIYEDEIEV